MPYDANLVLRGHYAGAYVDLDENDAVATSPTVNSDGNGVVDLGVAGSGALGLDCIVLLHDDPTTYLDTCDIIIQDSDHLTDGWQNLLSFPRLYCYMREVLVTDAATAFLGTDIGLVLTATANGAVGNIREISRNLLVKNAAGKIFVEMTGAGDTYATVGDTLTATAGTGVGIQGAAARRIQTMVTLVRRFSTPKRYIRCSITVSAGGNFGDVDILVTGSQHSHVNNLYH